MGPTLQNDKWAMKAIHYLARKNYSTKEIMDALVTIGIQVRTRQKGDILVNEMKDKVGGASGS